MQTFNILRRISPANQDKIVAHLEQHIDPVLQRDVSNYAPGRRRAWLQYEPTLVRDYTLKPAHRDERIWNYFTQILPGRIDCGLISRGPVGISMHRDASYAAYKAYGVNLGETVTFGYRECYSDFRWSKNANNNAPLTSITLEPGDVYEFCCKNPHGILSDISENRWSINFWSFKTQAGRPAPQIEGQQQIC